MRSPFTAPLAFLCITATQAFIAPQQQQMSALQQPSFFSSSFRTPFPTRHDYSTTKTTSLSMSSDQKQENSLPFWLDPNTKGGVIFWSIVLLVVPFIGYNFATAAGVDGIEAGKWIGGGFTAIGTFAWVGTYIFRVATKDMTYAKQLKDYENAVIAKRLEELDDDEIQALVEEIDRDDF